MPAKFEIEGRMTGEEFAPLVIAEIGINHEGSFEKAVKMVEDAAEAGCECVKFQCHVIDDEMIPAAKKVIPGNADVSIWDIMSRCVLTEDEDRELKKLTESKGMIYLSTPFSRAAADRLERLGVSAYKIGSGECNNYPLVRHIAGFGKPVILSTGMNDLKSIHRSVEILREADVPFALLHCTSIYPTPYGKVRLGAVEQLKEVFPDAVTGFSDHSNSIYPCLGAVALGASILERHFTSDKNWPGPDVPISMDPAELKEMIEASRAIQLSRGGKKTVLPEEQPTIDFAYACVVSTKEIRKGEVLSPENIWVKRPGNGEIKAESYEKLFGRKVNKDIPADEQISWSDISESLSDASAKEEAASFNRQIKERSENKFVPDIRNSQVNKWFFNNFWRNPAFIQEALGGIIEKLASDIKENSGEESSLLDIGCGPGYHSLELARYGLNVTGIDISESAVETARSYLQSNPPESGKIKLNYLTGDFLNFDFKEKYDAASFFFSLHHFASPEAVMKRLKKVLNPGALVFAIEPARELFGRKEALAAFIARYILSASGKYYSEIKLPSTEEELEKTLENIVYEYRNAREKSEGEQSPHDNDSTGKEMLEALRNHCDEIYYRDDYCFSDRITGGVRGEDISTETELGLKMFKLDRLIVQSGLLNASQFIWTGRLKG